jgi:Salmonella virulence plasmid 65kDa B protein/FG-GAP-like repeat
MQVQLTLVPSTVKISGLRQTLTRLMRLGASIALGLSLLMTTASQAQTTVPGKIPGQFAVSPSGAATYSIPIQVPPGIAGMEPRLSLEYNSQAGAGIAGVGWNIGGLSSITRCPQTPAQDGVPFQGSVKYDWNDRYCLDGQRSILVDNNGNGVSPASQLGTHYRTEIDNFSRIWPIEGQGAGHKRFEVKTKSGLTMQYGETADSRVEADGRAEVAFWAVNKIADLSGNTMTISYYEDVGYGNPWFYPSSIKYAGNEVYFDWQPLANTGETIVPQYHAGALSQRALILREVRVLTAGLGQTKVYKMNYGNSPISSKARLTSVTECAGSECKKPLTINYPSEGFSNFRLENAFPNDGYQVGANGYRYLQGDFNGDGKQDLLHLVSDSEVRVWLSNGDGTFDKRPAYRPWPDYQISANNYRYEVGDFNGDGKTDIIHFVNNRYAHVWLSNGDGTFTPQQAFPNTGYVLGVDGDEGGVTSGYRYITGDFNGDGRTDLVHFVTNSRGSYVHVWLSNGDGTFWIRDPYGPAAVGTHPGYRVDSNNFNYKSGDFDGDGKTDLIHFYNNNYAYVWLSNGDGTFRLPAAFPNTGYSVGANDYNYITGDFNGDGKTDLFHFVDNTYGNMWLSKGNGSFEIRGDIKPWPGYAMAGADPARPYNYKSGDFNGDGKDDLIHFVNNNYAHVWLSKGDGTFVPPTAFPNNNSYAVSSNNYNFMVGDFNGDGRSDMVHFVDNTYWRVWNAQGYPSDMAASFSNGEVLTNLTYTPITKGNYTKDADAVYPRRDLQIPLQVVSQVDTSNGLGGVNSTQYTYGGLKAEQGTGRGMLGFRWMYNKELSTDFSTLTEYRQDFPYTGMPSLTYTTHPASQQQYKVVKYANNTPGCKIPQNAANCTVAPGNRYFPYIASNGQSSWDINGTLLSSMATYTEYNLNPGDSQLWGDPTKITITNAVDGSSKVIANEYELADATNGNWRLGRLKKATVTSTRPDDNVGVGTAAGGGTVGLPPPVPPTPAQLQAAKAALPSILQLLLDE